MTTEFFTSDLFTPPAVLRRENGVDEVFLNGEWRPTSEIVDWYFGNDDFVERATEAEARALAPAAFTSPA